MTVFRRCAGDEDYAKASLFILERRHDLHPAFTTLDIVALLYSYITDGHLFVAEKDDGGLIAASAYYRGTPELGYEDKRVAFVDLVVVDRAFRGSRVFMAGLKSLVDHVSAEYPEIEEMRFAALADNAYVCKLYAKLARFSGIREGAIGQEMIYSEKIARLGSILGKYDSL
ncbi:GNAT family N-acetyltransferase [Paenibacillaceae bacterium WGS1546]|uniref:GNAT family N-acetyltransferase n=1 Tax=Cohnella sp. WGS1546 TaxID=3366810 RepID=UPI00372CECF1